MQTHITRRFFVKGAGLLSASAALAACSNNTPQEPATTTESTAATNEDGTSPLLAIIHTNDSHGHDTEVKTTEDAAGNFSMAAVPALRQEWENKGYDVLLVDAGDATQGTPLVDVSLGESAISFMNSCGYDLMCVGNHEFDRGDDQIKKFEEAAEFPLISASVLMKGTDKLRFAPNKLFELADGSKVGVFGLTTPSTLTSARPNYTEPFDFLEGDDLYKCAQDQVDDLRKQGADLVVCVGHLGNEEACQPSTSRDVLTHVQGIDLFIDGHDHELVEEEVEGTLLVETGCYMKNIGLVVIDAGVPTNESVAYGDYDGIDTATQAIIDDVQRTVDKELDVELATVAYKLEGDKNAVRSRETNLGDLYCDAMLYDAEQVIGKRPDCALINSGAIRASIEEGEITLKDVKTVMPFPDQVCALNITGAQLLEALEAGCQNIGLEGVIGAFPQVAGIEFTLNSTVPYEKGETYPDSTFAAPAAPGARVTINKVGNRDFDENATYLLATTDFLTLGGDTYYQIKLAAEKEDPIICDFNYEALVGYLIGPLDHDLGDRYAKPQGRITITGA